jgi:WXG100 family type VII secretion target
MSSKDISLNFEAISTAVTKLKAVNDAFNTQNTNVVSLISELRSQFSGHTAEAFESCVNTWTGSAKQLNESLDALKQFLTKASEEIAKLDSNIASQLNKPNP